MKNPTTYGDDHQTPGTAAPKRCRDCAGESDGPCPMCAVALYGTAGARAYLDMRLERDVAVWLHAELKHKLGLPCGECHPCSHWAEETWRREGRSVPHFHDWQALNTERELLLWLHAEAVWQREHARNLFLDHYNAASGTADRVGELEAALRERTAQRDDLRTAVSDALHGLDSDLGDDAPLGARVEELHESFLDATRYASDLVGQVQRARNVHQEFRIYVECGHQHTEGEPGVREVDDAGLVCEAGYRYSVCRHCCCDDRDFQSDNCGSRHEDGACWPCPTTKALEDAAATDDADLKARLLALRQEILQNRALTGREVEDLKAAVLLLIMHLNHRAADRG